MAVKVPKVLKDEIRSIKRAKAKYKIRLDKYKSKLKKYKARGY